MVSQPFAVKADESSAGRTASDAGIWNVRRLEGEGELSSVMQRKKGWLGGRPCQDLGTEPTATSERRWASHATALLLALETRSAQVRLG